MIAYASRTGNNRHVIQQLGLPSVEITADLTLDAPFFVLTYTDRLGEVPAIVQHFLKKNHAHCTGVIASGNSNFGHDVFCGSANKIHKAYDIPIIRKLELRGFEHDYTAIKEAYSQLIAQKEPIR